MPRVFVYIVVVSVLICTAQVQQVSLMTEDQRIDEEPQVKAVHEELFKKSFKQQRMDHAYAVKRLEKIDNYERLYKMIMILGENMIDTIETSKEMIERADFDLDSKSLPQNFTIQSAISGVLENTLLFGDIVLHFPHVMHRILKKQEKWNQIIDWSLNFTNRTRYLLDQESLDIIKLMSQELRITEREPGYINPYRRLTESRDGNKGETKTKRSSRKEKRKRGPQMTKIDFQKTLHGTVRAF
ncbi:coiled-coil domain-containing protein 134 [Colletes latitarsis]|uniref:coiled-coil domain-containing protein 134 n=1 Tax=Colletes latitarsis TaxID=2605962 RepID=UPI0040367162